MLAVSHGWSVDVERGPDCLFIKIHETKADSRSKGQDSTPLAEALWSVLDRHFIYRVILELDDVNLLQSQLLDQLVALSKRIQDRNGLLRIAGLSDRNRRALERSHLDEHLFHYGSRSEALMPPEGERNS